MAITGTDYSYARPTIAELQSLGIQFVCRYAGGDPAKQLTADEAITLSNAGISIVCNFESAGLGGDYLQGRVDALAADAHFAMCGLSNAVIYFSIDFNESNPAAMDAYFQGINSIIGVSRTDCYGETALILHLRSAGLIRPGQSGWRTMSVGWAGGAGDTSDFAMEQVWPPFNSDMDTDYAYVTLSEVGALFYGGNPIAPPPPPPFNTITVPGVTISQVQTRLNVWGAHLIVDDVEGPLTLAAIKTFQTAHGLTVDGFVGPITWGLLFQNPPPPVNTNTYQWRAQHNTFTPVTSDGVFGIHTIQALQFVLGATTDGVFGVNSAKALQKLLGVTQDGIIGQNTVRHLQAKLGVATDGIWGPVTTRALQVALNKGLLY